MAICLSADLDRVFQALGDPSRRRMLESISVRDGQSAGELGSMFDFAQPTISKHLRVLERAGIIVRHIEGRHHTFSLHPDTLKNAELWISRHLRFWENSFERLDEFLDGEELGSRDHK